MARENDEYDDNDYIQKNIKEDDDSDLGEVNCASSDQDDDSDFAFHATCFFLLQSSLEATAVRSSWSRDCIWMKAEWTVWTS